LRVKGVCGLDSWALVDRCGFDVVYVL
jgi:hypothetical protein